MEDLTIDEIEDRDVATARGAVISGPGETLLSAIHTLEAVERISWDNRLGRASRKYTPEVLSRMVTDEIKTAVVRVRQMREAELLRNDEMRSRGTPYVERMKIIDSRKIEWCDREEKHLLKILPSFRVRPLAEWFDAVDYSTAMSRGMSEVIRTKLCFNLHAIII